MPKHMRLASVAEQVIAGTVVLLLACFARFLARTAPLWVQWALWGLLVLAVALLLGIVVAAGLARVQPRPARRVLRHPLAVGTRGEARLAHRSDPDACAAG